MSYPAPDPAAFYGGGAFTLSPSSGPAGGGTPIEIPDYPYPALVSGVFFGGVRAPGFVRDGSVLRCATPAHARGIATVTLEPLSALATPPRITYPTYPSFLSRDGIDYENLSDPVMLTSVGGDVYGHTDVIGAQPRVKIFVASDGGPFVFHGYATPDLSGYWGYHLSLPGGAHAGNGLYYWILAKREGDGVTHGDSAPSNFLRVRFCDGVEFTRAHVTYPEGHSYYKDVLVEHMTDHESNDYTYAGWVSANGRSYNYGRMDGWSTLNGLVRSSQDRLPVLAPGQGYADCLDRTDYTDLSVFPSHYVRVFSVPWPHSVGPVADPSPDFEFTKRPPKLYVHT